jgi:hypothetical protein
MVAAVVGCKDLDRKKRKKRVTWGVTPRCRLVARAVLVLTHQFLVLVEGEEEEEHGMDARAQVNNPPPLRRARARGRRVPFATGHRWILLSLRCCCYRRWCCTDGTNRWLSRPRSAATSPRHHFRSHHHRHHWVLAAAAEEEGKHTPMELMAAQTVLSLCLFVAVAEQNFPSVTAVARTPPGL